MMEVAQTIKGYELRERIGSGGFGVVHRAYQSTLGREVAIKIILPHYVNHPDFIRRFESEAQLIARLEHPHIVPLYDYWREPEGAYLVMRWLRGGNLREALQNGPCELEPAARLIDQITAALALAHRHGIIHRDLKPANILLDEDGNAYLSDFGIAKDILDVVSEQTGTDIILGSPDYLSPEQARSEPVSPQTDIYSLGVVLYEILTGQHPFPNKTPVEHMYHHLNDPVPLITTLDDGVADGVNRIIQKATAKNPANRHADVLEIAAAFRQETALNVLCAGESLVEQLTLREQEVLQLLIDGCSNHEIADQLVITPGTVKWYLSQIYRKLRVRSRVQAIVRARELNLIALPESGETADTGTTYVHLPEPENPYKGLRAFQAADARDFFGREKLVGKLVTKLAGENHLSRFLAIVGPSGSGKSSIVKAGLIPAVWRGELPGSDRWFVIEVVPGPRPLDELEVALTRVAADPSANLREHLERDQYGLLRVAGLILPDDGSELVIVIDQFEELFTLVEDEAVRAHFLDLIHAAVTDARSRLYVIVTLRADFYDRPLHYPEFGELMRSRMETVLPLSAKELDAAIVRPAERVGLTFEPGLVTHIVSDVHYQPGALPLLQYALTELFENRDERTLTQAAYHMLGGAVGALAKRADDVYCEYDESGRDVIRQMFLRLVAIDEDAAETRRRVLRSELLSIAADEDVMDEVIDTYAAYRLLTLDRDPTTRKPTVELAHEAILREWRRLREWLDESRHDIRQQRLLAAAVVEWQQHNQDTDYLLHGSRLDQFAAWSKETNVALITDERAYLDASVLEKQRQQETERERQQREVALARRSANRLRYLIAAMSVFLVIAVILIGITNNALDNVKTERNRAQLQADVNRSLVLANSAQHEASIGHSDLALVLALRATSIEDPPAEAKRMLIEVALGAGTRAVMVGHNHGVKSVAISPDSQWALSGGCAELTEDETCVQGELILWTIGGRASDVAEKRQLEGHTDWVNSLAFDPIRPRAISASEDGTLILWDVDGESPSFGTALHRLEGHTGGVNAVAFSADGLMALSGGDDTTLLLWDVDESSPTFGEVLRHFTAHVGSVHTVAFSSPNDEGITTIFGADEKTLTLWNATTGDVVNSIEIEDDPMYSAAISPSGNIMFSSGTRLTIQSWDPRTGEWLTEYMTNEAAFSFAFTPDERTVLLGASSSVRRWDIQTQQEIQSFHEEGLSSHVDALVVSPDGRLALVGFEDGSLRLWNLEDDLALHRFLMDSSHMCLELSPDGRYLLIALHDAVLWDIESGKDIRRFSIEGVEGVGIAGASFSPDGQTVLLSGGAWMTDTDQAYLGLWNIETGEEVRRFEGGHKYNLFDAAISPDGRTALAGSSQWVTGEFDRGDLILWGLESGDMIRVFDNAAQVTSVEFSADGNRALTSSGRGHVILWDVNTGQAIRRFEPRTDSMDAAFGPGETFVLASTIGGLVMWDTETGELIRRFTGHDQNVNRIDISPDGQYALSLGYDGEIILWDLVSGEVLRRYRGHAGGLGAVVFSHNGETAFSVATGDYELVEWQISDRPLGEVIEWVYDNRYVRDFTCEERVQYSIEPLCE